MTVVYSMAERLENARAEAAELLWINPKYSVVKREKNPHLSVKKNISEPYEKLAKMIECGACDYRFVLIRFQNYFTLDRIYFNKLACFKQFETILIKVYDRYILAIKKSAYDWACRQDRFCS